MKEMYLVKGSLHNYTNHAKANCILIFESSDRINSLSCGLMKVTESLSESCEVN
jgi:hypothetical protein